MKLSRILSAAAAAICVLAASAVSAAPLKFDVDAVHSSVEFKIRHLVAKSSGKFKDFSGSITMDPAKPAEGSVQFTIKAASIDTGNAKRDDHLRSADFFEVEKFPEITFKSSRITAKGGTNYEVAGVLTMHGVSQPITLPVQLSGPGPSPFVPGASIAGFSATAKISRKDFGVSWNKTLDSGGTILSDDVDVTIELEAMAKPDAPASAAPAPKK